MSVRYKKKGKINIISYSKGMTRLDVQLAIERRILKREKELEKRQWIVDEYNSLLSKQAEDRQWLEWVKKQSDEDWEKEN